MNQIITSMPPIAPPYISDTTHSEKILTKGFVLLLNNGLSLLWIQLLPHQMEKEVNMKKRFAAIISIVLYRVYVTIPDIMGMNIPNSGIKHAFRYLSRIIAAGGKWFIIVEGSV